MKKIVLLTAAAIAMLSLSACATDGDGWRHHRDGHHDTHDGDHHDGDHHDGDHHDDHH